jgi:hypothetical protein
VGALSRIWQRQAEMEVLTWPCAPSAGSPMFAVSEAKATAIRDAFNEGGTVCRRGSCAGYSPYLRTMRTPGSAPEPSPVGNRILQFR